MVKDIIEKSNEWLALKEKSEALSAELKEVNAKWDELEKELIETMADEGVPSLKIDGIGGLSISSEHYFNVPSSAQDTFFQYLRDHGAESLIRDYVPPRSLTTWIRNHVQELTQTLAEEGEDEFNAENRAIEEMQKLGASYFKRKKLSFRKARSGKAVKKG